MVPWIQVYSNILTHDKTYSLAERLKVPNYAAVGLMVSLWAWAAINAPNGDITRYPPRAIADAAGWNKKPNEFYQILLDVRLIEQMGETVQIRNWERYASLLMDMDAAQKKKSSERVKRFRERKRNGETTSNESITDDQCNGYCNVTETPCNASTLPNLTEPKQNITGDGGEESSRACVRDPVENSLDNYLGMTDTLKAQTRDLAHRLFRQYFGRSATEHDAYLLFGHISGNRLASDGGWEAWIDPDKVGVAEYAFATASRAGATRWSYLESVFARCSSRGLTTRDACEQYDTDRTN